MVVTLSDGRVIWSEADDALLLARKASGKTVAEIAEGMSRSHSAVASRLAHIRRRERLARRREVGLIEFAPLRSHPRLVEIELKAKK